MEQAAPLTLIRVVDTETTGLADDAQVCEVGWTDVRLFPTGWAIEAGPFAQLCAVSKPIEPEARAAHHIKDEELVGQPSFESLVDRVVHGADLLAAHNAEFDKKFFPDHRLRWLCTMKMAAALWRDLPSYGNQALRYRRGLQFADEAATMPTHRAGPDTLVTAAILIELLNEKNLKGQPYSMTALEKVSAEPRRILRVQFGKHRGQLLSELPTDYLEWIVEKSDMDEAVKWNCRRELRRR